MSALRAKNPDRATMQAAMKKSADALNEQIGKILTSDEIGKLKSLAGKPFVAKQPIGGPGGGPGGGGPGA